jgi:hypothetical protein
MRKFFASVNDFLEYHVWNFLDWASRAGFGRTEGKISKPRMLLSEATKYFVRSEIEEYDAITHRGIGTKIREVFGE